MGERRHRKHLSLERVMGIGRKKKKNGNGRSQTPKSATHMRFFEQSDQEREAAQIRNLAKKVFGKPREGLVVDSHRQFLFEQMLANIPEYTEDRRSELFEAESDRKLEDEKLKRLSDCSFKTRNILGDRQSIEKTIARDKRRNRTA